MYTYQDLKVRQKAMDLVEEIYLVTKEYPKEELYGITSQMRRSAISIPSNIAEGDQRNTKKENINFLCTAKGSAAELHTQILLSQKINLINEKNAKLLEEKIIEILKMLSSLIKSKKDA